MTISSISGDGINCPASCWSRSTVRIITPRISTSLICTGTDRAGIFGFCRTNSLQDTRSTAPPGIKTMACLAHEELSLAKCTRLSMSPGERPQMKLWSSQLFSTTMTENKQKNCVPHYTNKQSRARASKHVLANTGMDKSAHSDPPDGDATPRTHTHETTCTQLYILTRPLRLMGDNSCG